MPKKECIKRFSVQISHSDNCLRTYGRTCGLTALTDIVVHETAKPYKNVDQMRGRISPGMALINPKTNLLLIDHYIIFI